MLTMSKLLFLLLISVIASLTKQDTVTEQFQTACASTLDKVLNHTASGNENDTFEFLYPCKKCRLTWIDMTPTQPQSISADKQSGNILMINATVNLEYANFTCICQMHTSDEDIDKAVKKMKSEHEQTKCFKLVDPYVKSVNYSLVKECFHLPDVTPPRKTPKSSLIFRMKDIAMKYEVKNSPVSKSDTDAMYKFLYSEIDVNAPVNVKCRPESDPQYDAKVCECLKKSNIFAAMPHIVAQRFGHCGEQKDVSNSNDGCRESMSQLE